MDMITDYRIRALTPDDRELARRAERARLALERVPAHAHRRSLLRLLTRAEAQREAQPA